MFTIYSAATASSAQRRIDDGDVTSLTFDDLRRKMEAIIFMQELGHSFLGDLDTNNRGTNGGNSHSKCNCFAMSAAYELCNGRYLDQNNNGVFDGADYPYIHEGHFIDYHSNIWSEINREGVGAGLTKGRP